MKYLGQDTRIGIASRWLGLGGACLAIILVLQNERLSVLSTFALLLYSLYFVIKKYKYGFLSVPFLYIAALGLFHLGMVVPWALGLDDLWDVWWFGYDDLNRPLALVALAIMSIQLGMVHGEFRTRANPAARAKQSQPAFFEDPALLAFGLAVIAIGASAYVVGFTRVFGTQFFSMTYAETFEVIGESDYRLLYFGIHFVPIGLYLALAGASKARLILPLGLLSIWAAWQLFTGVRNRALIVGAVAVYILVKKGIKIPRSFYVAGLVAVLFIIPLVGVLRQEVPTHRLTELPLEDLNPLYGVMEMGGSLWPLVGTYRLVGQTGFHYGSTYITSIRMAFPARGLRYKMGGGFTGLWENLIPNLWFVASTSPVLLKMNIGPSFTPIAEAYMNFGFPGVLAVFIAIGYAIVRLERSRISDAYVLAARAIILAPLIWSVRSDATVIVRPFIWGLVCVGIAWLISKFLEGVRSNREVGAMGISARTLTLNGKPAPQANTVTSVRPRKLPWTEPTLRPPEKPPKW